MSMNDVLNSWCSFITAAAAAAKMCWLALVSTIQVVILLLLKWVGFL